MKKNSIRSLAVSAIIAALYAVLTIVLAPISYGALQFRVSEALCIFPYLLPYTSWGLFVGCIIANLMTGNVFDIVFGSLATLLAALCTAAIGKKNDTLKNRLFACLMPVLFNAVIVSAVIVFAYNGTANLGAYLLCFVQIAVGEAGVLYLLGLPLIKFIGKSKVIEKYNLQ